MENHQHSTSTFRQTVEQKLGATPPRTTAAYALQSLLDTINAQKRDTIDGHTLRMWTASMLIDGKKPATVSRYLGTARALYRAHSTQPEAVENITTLLDNIADTAGTATEARANLAIARTLTGRNRRSDEWPTLAAFLRLLYLPDTPLAHIAAVTTADTPHWCPQVADIDSSLSTANGRKYLYPLGQGKVRPGAIERTLTNAMLQQLAAAGMRFTGGFSRASITAIWVAAALDAGISLPDIRALVGTVPPAFAPLSLVEAATIDEQQRREIICRVADTICSHTNRWYALRLRKSANIEQLRKAILANPAITLYYPTRTEVRKEGHRRITEQVPYLPGIAFFATRPHNVRTLMARIGNLAWCFRTTASPASPYAPIATAQMAAFQRYIGQFTPDIQVELVDTATLTPGRLVRITGGIMAGYEGRIVDIDTASGRRMFFLSIADRTAARWTATVEDIFIEPVTVEDSKNA